MAAEQIKSTLSRAIENFNQQSNRDGYFDLYDDNVTLHGFPPELPPGIDGLKQFYRILWAAFPDAQVAVEDMVSEGNKLVARYTFTGTHSGEFLGIPPTNRHVAMSGITILRMIGGKCVERWNERDSLGLMRQLGAMGES